MTDMIEQVARALHKKQMAGKWELLPETVRATYLDDAITAIKAMREPSHEMLRVGSWAWTELTADCVGDIFPAMIDAALKGAEQ